MAWRTIATSNDSMCESLHRLNLLSDERILSAFKAVDRGLFAYGDDFTQTDR
jgi:hypothetical protein